MRCTSNSAQPLRTFLITLSTVFPHSFVLFDIVSSMVSRHTIVLVSTSEAQQAPSKKAGKKVEPAKKAGGRNAKVAKVCYPSEFFACERYQLI
jgi:hypothetical protein